MKHMRMLAVAGDYSGDMHAASLCRALHRREDISIEIAAIGGESLRKESDIFLQDLVGISVFGFIKPFARIISLRSILNKIIKKYLIEKKPDAVILVDYYGFNIHVAKIAHALSIPVMYFISPQIWASRSYRIHALKKYIRRMFVIFPFEKALYESAGLPVTYIGHPLVDRVPEAVPDKQIPDVWHIGLLPGSRIGEIEKHMSVLLCSAEKIRARIKHVRFSLFIPESIDRSVIERWCTGRTGTSISIITEKDYGVRKTVDFAISASGTATLENALLGIPMVVIYKISWLSYIIARILVHVKYICIVNIIFGRKIVSELIQYQVSSIRITEKTIEILSNNETYQEQRKLLLSVRDVLGHAGAVDRASMLIVQELT
ncbi:MAG: lipid-A-disaccharide synthase [bacterium]